MNYALIKKHSLFMVLISFPFIVSANNSSSKIIEYNGKMTPKSYIQIYAHRGGRGIVPENTIPAYASALRLGVDYVDMDINMTKDGILVATHNYGLNPILTRNKSGQWIKNATLIKDLTLEQLQSYDVGTIKKGTEYSKYFPFQKSMNHVEIPTLRNVISFVKEHGGNNIGFNIEIKSDPSNPDLAAKPEKYAEELYRILKEENVLDKTEVQSADWRCLLAVQKLDKKIKTAYITAPIPELITGSKAGLWTAGYNIKDYDNSFPKMITALGGSCWNPYEMNLTKSKVDEAHNLNLKVVPYCWPEKEHIDFSLKRIRQLITWNVDGILTDRPDELRAVLSSMGYNLPQNFQIKW